MYEWVKVLHILALIAWMAGLFYLPRLFVYHSGHTSGSELDATFKVMERRLLGAIMRPAAVATLLSGLALAYLGGFGHTDLWLVLKLVGVLAMFGFHGFLESAAGRFARGQNLRTARFFRIANEVPTVLLVWIVIFVVIKPFS